MAEHTKRDWKIYGSAKNLFGEEISLKIVGEDGFPVAEVETTVILPDYTERTGHKHWAHGPGEAFIERSPEEVQAIAELIVNSVKLLPKIVEGVKDLITHAENSADPDPMCDKAILRVRKLIKKAEKI